MIFKIVSWNADIPMNKTEVTVAKKTTIAEDLVETQHYSFTLSGAFVDWDEKLINACIDKLMGAKIMSDPKQLSLGYV